MTIRDIKPIFAQKFLGDAFHKMKEKHELAKAEKKAIKSVYDIKAYAVKTSMKQTKQKIVMAKQLIDKCEGKLKSQDVMLNCLHEERFISKKKQNAPDKVKSPESPESNPSQNQMPRKAFNASMKPPVPGKRV